MCAQQQQKRLLTGIFTVKKVVVTITVISMITKVVVVVMVIHTVMIMSVAAAKDTTMVTNMNVVVAKATHMNIIMLKPMSHMNAVAVMAVAKNKHKKNPAKCGILFIGLKLYC